MKKYKPIEIGDRFGRLTVVKFDHKNERNNKNYWLCVCDCGNFKVIRGAELKNGHTRSCGCLKTIFVKKINKYKTLNDKIEVSLYNSKEKFYISKEFKWVLKDHCWRINDRGYITTSLSMSNKTVMLHRLIIEEEIKEGFMIDHIDGNPLNNCLDNLRVVSPLENSWNIKRRKDYGIKRINSVKNPYSVEIGYKNQHIYLGYFPTLEDARNARDDWEDHHERKEYFRKEVSDENNKL